MIAFDFDGTLIDQANRPNMVTISLLRRAIRQGLKVRIITSRDPAHECVSWRNQFEPRRLLVSEFLQSEELPIQATYTNHRPKALAMQQLGTKLLFDNDPAEITAAQAVGLYGVLVDATLRATQKDIRCGSCGWSVLFVGSRGCNCTVCGSELNRKNQ